MRFNGSFKHTAFAGTKIYTINQVKLFVAPFLSKDLYQQNKREAETIPNLFC